jgi:sugar phosphate isomerase/epimerase
MIKQAPSVQLYTLRDFIAKDLAGTLARVAAAGFTQVEPYHFVALADEYAAALKANNLTAPTGHAMLMNESDEVIRATFAAAKKLGITTVIDPITDPKRWQSKDDILEIAAELNRVAELAVGTGLRIGYHNHAWEFANSFDGELALDVFIDAIRDDIVLEIDAFWCTVGGTDAASYVAKLGERVVALHIKDGNKDGDTAKQVPAGEGQVPIREVLAAAPHALPVVEFDEYSTGDLFEGIAQSLAYIIEVR